MIRGRHKNSPLRLAPLGSLLVTAALCLANGAAQEPPCSNPDVASIVSRPALASATDLTQCGVVELEYGLERQWLGAGAWRSDFSGGLRFGLTPDLDFHWFAANFLSLTDVASHRTGYGDNWLGLKYRLSRQTRHRPSFGLLYQVKAPSGDLALGSSGQVDHQLAALVSKDIWKFHFDFNAIPQWVGRADASGWDHNVGFAWATWLPLSKRVTLVLEPYGFTALNGATPGFASAMAGFSFQAHRRLYLDAGFDAGLSHFGPQKRVYGGVTCAVGNVYTWLRPR